MASELFTRPRIGQIATSILDMLAQYEIVDYKSLESCIGIEHVVDNEAGEKIVIQLRPSNMDTQAVAITYLLPDGAMPIEARLNSALEYSRIIMKLDTELPGYNTFYKDNAGNYTQDRSWNLTTIDDLRTALERLQ